MSHLYLPWGDRYGGTNRLPIRNQFASSLELHKQSSYEYQEPPPRQRSPSLPPIRSIDPPEDTRRSKEVLNRNLPSAKRFAFYDEDGEGDTSGYGSETVNHIRRQSSGSHNPVVSWQQTTDDNRHGPPSGGRSTGNDDVWSRSPRSASGEEGRLRWGDRGVATGRLWEPTAPTARLPQMQNQKKGTPSWVERGLNMIENTAEVLVIDQSSSTHSGFDCDRSSCQGSDEGRTFLRGQNVPLEPEIKAERENQRIKALELQSAILSQLEDREKQRQEERERKLREERLEELRLQRQQEEDLMKLEEEKRRNQEKQLHEQRKLETLKKALEDAEKKAKYEKEKRFVNHRQNNNLISDDLKNTDDTHEEHKLSIVNENSSPTKSNRTYDVYSARSQNVKSKDTSHHTTEHNTPRSVSQGNINMFTQQNTPQTMSITDNHYNIVPLGLNGEIISGQPNCIQLAVLVPQSLSGSVYSMSLSSLNNINESPEKILTPRKYRSMRNKDAWTQTDGDVFKTALIEKAVETDDAQRNADKDIDENAPQDSHHNSKKDRRFRSEERYKKELENRPKWGVNRPAAQYKKQSEKDPFYSQKRKMRYKYRTQPRQYTSQSSEDSRSPSPPGRAAAERLPPDHKHRNSLSQSYWRSKRSSQDFSQPMSLIETTNNVPIQTDIGHLSASELQYSEPNKSPVNTKLSPSKRLTLSQKFINDKYGNRKLWIDEANEKNGKSFETDNRKKLIDQMNKAKRDYLERNEDQEISYAIKTKL